jgi:nicotinamidase-related amidase
MTWDPRKLDSQWPFDVMSTDVVLDRESTALLVIDMQCDQMTFAPDSPMAVGHPRVLEYWNRRLNEMVVPNIQSLIGLFRGRDLKIVYTRNGYMTCNADEMTHRLRSKVPRNAPLARRNQPGYQIDERLAPREEDLVVDKLTSGSFTASFLDHALHSMGVRSLVITGILTDACVFGTARAAAELGYGTLVCEDACATFTQRAHDDALLMHARIFGRVDTTEAVASELNHRA